MERCEWKTIRDRYLVSERSAAELSLLNVVAESPNSRLN